MSVKPLLAMAGLHFIAMYLLMYSMVDRVVHIYPSLNQIYMAGIMTAPMLIIEVILMRKMYASSKHLYSILAISLIVFSAFFYFIRNQTAISDKEFLQSMIPHHSGAILMCERSEISSPEIVELCVEIFESQKEEITEMEEILERINSS